MRIQSAVTLKTAEVKRMSHVNSAVKQRAWFQSDSQSRGRYPRTCKIKGKVSTGNKLVDSRKHSESQSRLE